MAYKRVNIRFLGAEKGDIEILEHETKLLTKKCTGSPDKTGDFHVIRKKL
jgi:hypothetical protein